MNQVRSGSNSCDYSVIAQVQNGQKEDLSKTSEWHEWADQLITDGGALEASSNNALACTSAPKLKSKTAYRIFTVVRSANPSENSNVGIAASGAQSKGRIRWTAELHEVFMKAVTILGTHRATPKGVLKLMKVEGLTIYHVKSHLQKYRTARYNPELIKAIENSTPVAPVEELSSLDLKTGVEITEALRLQMEVQKRLHEQLEIQRTLQLRIEEQGKYLRQMFEQQNKSSSPTTDTSKDQESTTADFSDSEPSKVDKQQDKPGSTLNSSSK